MYPKHRFFLFLYYTFLMRFIILLLLGLFVSVPSSFAYTTYVYTSQPTSGNYKNLKWTDCSVGGYSPTGVGLAGSAYFGTSTDSNGDLYQNTPCTPYHTTLGYSSNFNYISTSTLPMDSIGMKYMWYIGEGRTSPGTGYIEAVDSVNTVISDSTSSAHYWTVDGHTIQAFRIGVTAYNNLHGGMFIGNYTNTSYSLSDLYRFYGIVLTDDPSLQITDEASMRAILYQPSGGGGGDNPSVPSSVTSYIPATLYSQVPVIVTPYATSSYTFTSPITTYTGKQSGVVFVTTAYNITPSVSWGGVSMSNILVTGLDSGWKTTMFRLQNPTSTAPIVVSGLSGATSTRYISASVWSNASIIASFDQKVVNYENGVASLSLLPAGIPTVGVVGSLYYENASTTQVNLTSTVQYVSTSSPVASTFKLFTGICSNSIDCNVGYKYSFNSSFDGIVIGLSMYSTSSQYISASSSSNLPVRVTLENLASSQSFSSCISGLGISTLFSDLLSSGVCLGQTFAFWVLQTLFVPKDSDIEEMRDLLLSRSLNGGIVSSVFLIPFHLAEMSTTSLSTVGDLTIAVPSSISGGTYSTSSFTFEFQDNPVSSFDRSASVWINIILSAMMFMWLGYLFFRILF